MKSWPLTSAWQKCNLCEKIRQNIGVTVTGHKKAKIGVQRCVDRSNFDFLRRGHLGKILVGLWFKIEQRSVCCCIKRLAAVSWSLPNAQGHSLKLWHIDKNIPIMSKDKSIRVAPTKLGATANSKNWQSYGISRYFVLTCGCGTTGEGWGSDRSVMFTLRPLISNPSKSRNRRQ